MKAVWAAFFVTVCVLGTAGGMLTVNETVHRLEKRDAVAVKTDDDENRWFSYLPPSWQALLSVPRWQMKVWEYYFTVIKA
ncbi:MAG: hypothetical protein J6Q42_01960 [Clostridia bacterium]|jgi:hypothetical protein|nr:hypothetical protein [Clostridia bacterium]